jgi:magnesium-transporting ATPase (P-type)
MKKNWTMFYIIVILIALAAFIAGLPFVNRYFKKERMNNLYNQGISYFYVFIPP